MLTLSTVMRSPEPEYVRMKAWFFEGQHVHFASYDMLERHYLKCQEYFARRMETVLIHKIMYLLYQTHGNGD